MFKQQFIFQSIDEKIKTFNIHQIIFKIRGQWL